MRRIFVIAILALAPAWGFCGANNSGSEVDASGSSVNITNTPSVIIEDEGGIPAEVDNSTHALQTIAYEHHEIHSGSHYEICGFVTNGVGDTTIFAVTTPDSAKWAHMTFSAIGTSQLELHVHEGATVTGGVSVVGMNNNRNSTNTSILAILQDPVPTVAGTLLPLSESSGKEGATPARANTLGFVDRSNEIILLQDSTYTFTFTSRGAANIISFCGKWYEHTDKD